MSGDLLPVGNHKSNNVASEFFFFWTVVSLILLHSLYLVSELSSVSEKQDDKCGVWGLDQMQSRSFVTANGRLSYIVQYIVIDVPHWFANKCSMIVIASALLKVEPNLTRKDPFHKTWSICKFVLFEVHGVQVFFSKSGTLSGPVLQHMGIPFRKQPGQTD